MPVQEGDRVTAINVITGVETIVTIPPTDPNIRPVILDETIGLMTLVRISEIAGDGFLGPTSFTETRYGSRGQWVTVPYIAITWEEDGTVTYAYMPTTEFDPSLDYQIISTAGSGISDMTGDEQRRRRGGVGGRGGGGGGDGSGQQEGQGRPGDEPPSEPFPPIQDTGPDIEHTCSDEDPIPGEGEPGEGEPGEGKPPCPACAAGIPKGGKGKGEGEGQGSASGQGQLQGPEIGQGQGEGEGEGTPRKIGSGEGEGTGSGQGSGEGQGQGSGSGSGEGQGEGSGSGEGQGQGPGMPGGEGQPTPDGAGSASGGTPSNGGPPGPMEPGPPGPPGPPSDDENKLLEELLREQDLREEEQQEVESKEEEPDPHDFMEKEPEHPDEDAPDDYDDIFDESHDIDDASEETPGEFMDVIPTETPDRPFQDLSDEELQRLIDELMRLPEPMPGGGASPTSPPAVGPNQPQPGGGTPETPASPTLDIPQGQNWLWINPVTGQLDSGVERPTVGPWIHVLFMILSSGANSSSIMTFDDLRRKGAAVGWRIDKVNIFQPVPTILIIEFEESEDFIAYINSDYFNEYQDGYWEVVADPSASTITIQLMSNIDTDGPESRWVPVGFGEDVSSDTTQDINQQMQGLLEQINQENEMANERGIPTGYGEGSTSPYVPDSESNAAAQQGAADAGARAGKGDAQEARSGASDETDAARQEAQEAARNVSQASDLERAMEGTERAVENAMKANASADSSNESDVSNRNQAVTAANNALDGLEELLQTGQPMDAEISELVNEARIDLSNLEIGEGSSLAQSLAEDAREYRDEAVNAAESGTSAASADALEAARLATEAAVEARRAAIEGDSDDRDAVQQAQNMAQQAIDAANEAGADTSPYQQLLDQQPDFNNLGELAEEAEARNRDTMPGEFADISNPEVTEDMMNVARRATEIAEEAMSQANPTNETDMDAARYIQGQANSAVDNVEGRWDGDQEEIEDLRERIQEAAAELDGRAETMCALWNTTSLTWYRGLDGKILIFENIEDALVCGVQKGLIEEDFIDVPENWREIIVRPIGTGGGI